jgi:MazG family protein
VEAVKLGISDALDRHDGLLEDPSVVVLHHLGLDDEAITSVPWHELDRVAVDHLTCAWIPHLAAPVAGEVQRFAEVVAHLRRTCPWDREQTHASLRRHLLEEAYEVLEAIDALDVEGGEGFAHLEEELGDLLFQVVFHSTLAAEEGQFTLADVARGIHDKLVLRHPHVFSDADAVEPDQVVANWEQIKKAEKARESVFDGIPDALPALLFAGKVVKKMATLGGSSLGDERPEGLPEVPGLTAAAAALADPAPDLSAMEAEEVVGAALLAVVARCAELGVEPENALRAAATATRDVARAAELRAPGTVPSE